VVVRITGICLTEERSRRADKPSLHFYGALSIGRLPPMETHGNPKDRLRDLPLQGSSQVQGLPESVPETGLLRFRPGRDYSRNPID
jgi:hypothetical protein